MNHELVHRIDEAVLAGAGEQWTKVAMVIARTLDVVAKDLPPGEERFDIIASRIEALVSDGRLLSQGNIHNWRFSEVRRPVLTSS